MIIEWKTLLSNQKLKAVLIQALTEPETQDEDYFIP